MPRPRATESESCDEPTQKMKEGGSRRQRWSFAFKRRWFSTSSRDLKNDPESCINSPTSPGPCNMAGILISPRQTALGTPWSPGLTG
ncbi:unnamed protein product [Angiostrongylus costaricensis]|uniref:Uncharacterized protein n=1 Tax=Angiostrongylus costaricensis TaxID=334426 RepID=A0A0R3PQ89_ANGCS|nr:unnamed protein product [Angiostrongylus costaricensis]